MLVSLDVFNIVLIEKLNIQFSTGLNVITGETGAGKSILLDALGLAIGARSDISLIRSGCDKASVAATFNSFNKECKQLLEENDIDTSDGNLILRRTLQTDGKSKAWINDTPVSIKVLKEVGTKLVEVHSQFETNSLLDDITHIQYFDNYASKISTEYATILHNVRNAYSNYSEVHKKLIDLQNVLEKSELEKEFLEHSVTELRKINPQIGEEDILNDRRTLLMNIEKNSAILKDAQEALNINGKTIDEYICSVAHILERTKENVYENQISKLYDVADTISNIAQSIIPEQTDINELDSIEERLFAIRGLARKYRIASDELPNKLKQMEEQLSIINNSDTELKKYTKQESEALLTYKQYATQLSNLRQIIASKLRENILKELPDLKLETADFQVQLSSTEKPTYCGQDNICFLIRTNPGSPFAQLSKIASGGELARLMLALRVVLNDTNDNISLVFDEIDTGISGATASAVGQRLNKLASEGQILVITHSAQVAGFADKHFKISKHTDKDSTITNVQEITEEDRINEIARIISGATITPESIASAKTLIKNI
ncbi:MAG: DNA repair protein RecN [Alphaproteobacteria bacterium]|nr:DNA repair protein RecN [Alphaproteobacteria bacterium]